MTLLFAKVHFQESSSSLFLLSGIILLEDSNDAMLPDETITKPTIDPDISLSGFKIWIIGRQFPNSTDYWDANWLNVTAHCVSAGSQVWTQGPIIHLSEIEQWLSSLQALNKAPQGEVRLPCMEPELNAKVLFDQTGKGSLVVSITPDHRNEYHEFTFTLEPSCLQGVIKDLKSVLVHYPIRGADPVP